MFRYSTTYINILSFIISIIIFLITNFFISDNNFLNSKNIIKANVQVNSSNVQIYSDKNNNQSTIEEIKEDIKKYAKEETKEQKWYLEIPCINLKAEIKEGTTKEIMDDYIGHFEETKIEDGNIGLAAHNRGYKNNFFENLKYLKEGDKIYYRYNSYYKEYTVEKHIIIKDTDWTNLENTNDNTITLITCVENEKEYRRCIQGKETIY